MVTREDSATTPGANQYFELTLNLRDEHYPFCGKRRLNNQPLGKTTSLQWLIEFSISEIFGTFFETEPMFYYMKIEKM
jgi:hypothetical protein